MDAQKQIDFARGQQLALLRDCELPNDAKDISDGHGVKAVVLKVVLTTIDQFGRGRSGGCYASFDTIAKSANVGRRTAARAVKVLTELGLICVTNDGTRRGHRGARTNRYTIVWSELALRCNRGLFDRSGASDQSAPGAHNHSALDPDHSAPGADHSARGADHSAPGAHKACMNRIETNSSTTLQEETTSQNLDWPEVVVVLCALGLTNGRAATDAARANGLAAAEVAAIAGHYRAAAGAWGLGALHWRITQGVPGQDPAMGWPKPRAGHQARQQAAAVSRETQAARQREVELEATFGPLLDGMADADRDNLVDAAIRGDAFLWEAYRREGCDQRGLVREALLLFLEREHTGVTP